LLSCRATEARCNEDKNLLCLSFAIISVRGRIPRVLLHCLGLGLHASDLARKVVYGGEVERRRVERNTTPAQPRPAIPRRVDPPDEVKVAHILERAEIRPLGRKLSTAVCTHTTEGADLPISQTRQRQGRHSGLPFRG
jgi:hypothetical protein